MKRSEMLDLIYNMFRLYHLENLTHKESAERMLDFIERCGMLPPVRTPEPTDESTIFSVDYNNIWNEE